MRCRIRYFRPTAAAITAAQRRALGASNRPHFPIPRSMCHESKYVSKIAKIALSSFVHLILTLLLLQDYIFEVLIPSHSKPFDYCTNSGLSLRPPFASKSAAVFSYSVPHQQRPSEPNVSKEQEKPHSIAITHSLQKSTCSWQQPLISLKDRDSYKCLRPTPCTSRLQPNQSTC